MTLVAAAVCGLVIGLVIGGLGGGGGVLTVPALVYLLGFGAQEATAGSVIVVGLSAAVGVAVRIPARDLDWRTGLALGAVGTPAAYAGSVLNQRVDRPVLLLAFAAVTVLAAAAMLLADGPDGPDGPDSPDSPDSPGSPGPGADEGPGPPNERHGRTPLADESAVRSVRTAPRQWHPRVDRVDERHGRTPLADGSAVRSGRGAVRAAAAVVVGGGAAVGFLTGFLGVGGGFLVLPLLVVGLRTPLARATGTSLVAILVNSTAALLSRSGDLSLDWSTLVPFTLASLGATVLGHRVAGRLSGATLTRVFAALLLVVGVIVGVDAVLGT